MSPAISIEQKGAGHNPRSTVGLFTEIYDFLSFCSAEPEHRTAQAAAKRCVVTALTNSGQDIQDYDGKPIEILSPLIKGKKGEYKNLRLSSISRLSQARVDGTVPA